MKNTQRHGNQGFTLLEIAFVMIISGLLYVVAFNAYKYALNQDEATILYENTREMEGALLEFVARTGRYPCPADPRAAPGDANYGTEACALPFNVFATPRDANNDTVPDNVLIGAYPYQTILNILACATCTMNSKMTAANMFDPWGNKFTYAVTQNLTSVLTYNDSWGTIKVIDEYGQDIIDPIESAHTVLISHGKNGRGAYAASGQRVDPFTILPPVIPPPPPPPPGTIIANEIENANADGTFMVGLRNESNVMYNDDYVSFLKYNTSSLWQIVGGTFVTGTLQFQISNINPGNVGVGTDTPTEQLEILGNIRSWQMRATEFCDENDATICMPVSRLAGDDPEMDCGPGQAINSISFSSANCTTVFPAPVAATCDPLTEYMVGFSNLGNAICEPRP